jgi:hypothetical protein
MAEPADKSRFAIERRHQHARADFLQRRSIFFICRIVGKTAQMNAEIFRQMLEHMIGANFLALIGRKGDAVR